MHNGQKSPSHKIPAAATFLQNREKFNFLHSMGASIEKYNNEACMKTSEGYYLDE